MLVPPQHDLAVAIEPMFVPPSHLKEYTLLPIYQGEFLYADDAVRNDTSRK
jgi:hypothetical protein